MVSGGPQMSQQDKFAATSKEGIKKSLKKSGDKSLLHTWKSSKKACLEECRQSLRPKEAIPNTSHEKRMLTNEIIEINDCIP